MERDKHLPAEISPSYGAATSFAATQSSVRDGMQHEMRKQASSMAQPVQRSSEQESHAIGGVLGRNQVLRAECDTLKAMIGKLSICLPQVLSEIERINAFNLALKQHIGDSDAGQPIQFLELVEDALVQRWDGNEATQAFCAQIMHHVYEETVRMERFSDTLPQQQMNQGPGFLSLVKLIVHEISSESQELGELTCVPGVGFVSSSGLSCLASILSNDFGGLQTTRLRGITEAIDPMGDKCDIRVKAMCEFVEDSFLSSASVSAYSPDMSCVAYAQMQAAPSIALHRTQTSIDVVETPCANAIPFPSRLIGGSNFSSSLQAQSASTDSQWLGPPCSQARPLPSSSTVSSQTSGRNVVVTPTSEIYDGAGQHRDVASSGEEASYFQQRFSPLDLEVVTLYVRNIPARFTPESLTQIWNPQDSYNLLYMPFSHEFRRSLGCAIINFISHEAAVAFNQRWHGQLLMEDMGRRLEVNVARTQGLERNLWHMKCSKKIMRIRNPRYMPLLLWPDGSVADFRRTVEDMPQPANYYD